MEGFSGFIRAMGYARLAAVAGVTGLVAAVLIILMVRAGSPQMALLYADLDLVDASQIVEELEAADISYRQTRDGSALFVPEADVFSLRMRFAGDGLPARGTVGYEVFDNQSALGTTSYLQNLNHKRALEGELARTISGLSNIRSARVHLVLAERVRFSRDQTHPSASITVSPQRGELSRSEVQAIQHLVASAIDSLSPSSVAVIDDLGNLLAAGMGDNAGGVAGAPDERQAGVENTLRQRIEDILMGVVGPNAARVGVTADMDFSRTVTESQVFDPENQVVRSSHLEEGSQEDNESTPNAAVSVGAELPEATQSSNDGGSTNTESSLNEQIQYDNSRTISTIVNDGGGIVRLSAAVVVDWAQTTAADGTVTFAPRSEAEMDQIRALVRTAMGFDEARGDQVEVLNTRFTRAPEIIADIEEPGLFDVGRLELVRIIELVGLILIALLTIFFVFRPIMKRLLAEPDHSALAAAAAAASGQGAIAGGAAPQLPAPGGGAPAQVPGAAPQAIAAAPGQVALAPAMQMPAGNPSIDVSQIEGQVKESSVKKVGEIVTQHPDESVAILRSWLHEST